jgi:purine-binding chemotaxis protein CheW
MSTPTPQATSTTRQLVVFSLSEEHYALPIGQIKEVIRYTHPRAVASNDPWVRA